MEAAWSDAAGTTQQLKGFLCWDVHKALRNWAPLPQSLAVLAASHLPGWGLWYSKGESGSRGSRNVLELSKEHPENLMTYSKSCAFVFQFQDRSLERWE
jgi:hypothetical protein